jgi:hypothetical protein
MARPQTLAPVDQSIYRLSPSYEKKVQYPEHAVIFRIKNHKMIDLMSDKGLKSGRRGPEQHFQGEVEVYDDQARQTRKIGHYDSLTSRKPIMKSFSNQGDFVVQPREKELYRFMFLHPNNKTSPFKAEGAPYFWYIADAQEEAQAEAKDNQAKAEATGKAWSSGALEARAVAYFLKINVDIDLLTIRNRLNDKALATPKAVVEAFSEERLPDLLSIYMATYGAKMKILEYTNFSKKWVISGQTLPVHIVESISLGAVPSLIEFLTDGSDKAKKANDTLIERFKKVM